MLDSGGGVSPDGRETPSGLLEDMLRAHQQTVTTLQLVLPSPRPYGRPGTHTVPTLPHRTARGAWGGKCREATWPGPTHTDGRAERRSAADFWTTICSRRCMAQRAQISTGPNDEHADRVVLAQEICACKNLFGVPQYSSEPCP